MLQKNIDGLSFRIIGDSKDVPVIFLHGFPFDSTMWNELLDQSAIKCLAVLPDLRGLGKSDVPEVPFTMDHHADDVFKLIDHLNLDRPVICGFSMGGYVALRALERNHGAFRGVILVDTKSEADDDAGKLKRSDFIKKIRDEGVSAFVKDFIPPLFSPVTYRENPGLIEQHISFAEKADARGIMGALLAMAGRSDTGTNLEKFDLPALLIAGEDDRVTPPSGLEKMKNRLPHAQMQVVKNAGHMSPLENPAAIAETVGPFLSTLT